MYVYRDGYMCIFVTVLACNLFYCFRLTLLKIFHALGENAVEQIVGLLWPILMLC